MLLVFQRNEDDILVTKAAVYHQETLIAHEHFCYQEGLVQLEDILDWASHVAQAMGYFLACCQWQHDLGWLQVAGLRGSINLILQLHVPVSCGY